MMVRFGKQVTMDMKRTNRLVVVIVFQIGGYFVFFSGLV